MFIFIKTVLKVNIFDINFECRPFPSFSAGEKQLVIVAPLLLIILTPAALVACCVYK